MFYTVSAINIQSLENRSKGIFCQYLFSRIGVLQNIETIYFTEETKETLHESFKI